MNPIRRGDWFRCYRPSPYASTRLICFPHAGGGASFYRPWADELPADIELWAVRYPGREDRFGEPCIPTMTTLADRVADALEPALDRPVAIFGHSMGAAVGYEVARRLLAHRPHAVRHLFVSARPSPRHQRGHRTLVHQRDDDGLVAELAVLGGTDTAALDHPELRGLVLPVVRNDFRLIETYRPEHASPLPVPITALAAAADPRMTVAEAAGWAEATAAGFRLSVFPGDHFYLVPRRAAVLTEVLKPLTGKENPVTPPDELTVDGVRAAVATLLGVDIATVGADANLLTLGVDSIKLMSLASQWQRHGVEVPFGELAEGPTPASWSRLLLDAFGASAASKP